MPEVPKSRPQSLSLLSEAEIQALILEGVLILDAKAVNPPDAIIKRP